MGDYSAETLRATTAAFRRRYGETDRDIPPAVKADFLQWVLTRYHLTPYHQVHHTVVLPDVPGQRPEYTFGDDVSTWNGALLAAMSYKYAVTGDPATLDLICELVEGLHFFQQVTGKRGLFARCVVQSPQPVLRANKAYADPDGTIYHFRSDAAKGTYNQIAIGYATALMLVGDQLPAETQNRARHDLAEMVTHLLDHDYRITEADGKKPKYGDLRPLIGPFSVPFNSQVAYTMVAASSQFPGPDAIAAKMIRKEFERLRYRHHVYYENPTQHLLAPQMVSTSPFIKGMNDHNHLINAAYLGMMLELTAARKQSRQPDLRYLFEQGQTLAWTMQEIQTERNALCGFMYAGLFRDPTVFQSVVPKSSQESALRQLDYIVGTSIEQIRRAPLERFYVPGQKVETREPQWVDAQRPDEVYFWKAGAMHRWEPNGPPSNILSSGIDYLYAYWLMRYFRLSET